MVSGIRLTDSPVTEAGTGVDVGTGKDAEGADGTA